MQSIDKGRLFFTLFLLSIAVVFAFLAIGYDPKARLIPLAVSVAAILLGVPLIVRELFPLGISGKSDSKPADVSGNPAQPRTVPQAAGLLKILLWMAGFLALIFFLGFYVGIIFFSLAYLKVHARVGWPRAVLVSAALWFFIFFIFGKGMELDLFEGILMGEILPPL